ncbi:MAG: LabA [Candidatus Jorgensenbacteria bacterium GW2011_GWA1_48_11]|uniref:LabA n=1 Tax=Candidatus Jorgensenbacteria bacterium GW2011_GWA1_48_11 TaxID=1618660 RepID=A0A0G1UBU8_9BACT|nr:MAG: LabA [Candidatus Jorgensenbacteria bacterium GW2011_GWA1_48_11]KKW12082.1 MAG: LabA [Candidatus Jorgensenbacteria bacterium GW2011_GWB1_49_9]
MTDKNNQFEFKMPPKPKAGLYIDDANLYKRGKASGWMTDYKKLYKWVAEKNTIVYARIYKGRPKYEPAKSISEALEKYFESIGYSVTGKNLKKLRDNLAPLGFRNKCNFDVEMHDEIMNDLKDVDIVYICSGDSDFIRTKNNILKSQKRIKFVAYENNCAWEIRTASWYVSLDSIRVEVERFPKPH